MFTKHKVCILTLSRYPDLFAGLDDNINEFASNQDRVVILDGFMIEYPKGWLAARGPSGPFCYAHNVNLGLSLTDPDADILLMGDDVRLKDTNAIRKLHDLAYSDDTLGMLSPLIIGGADNPLLLDPPQDRDISYTERYIPLVCTYIKRNALNAVGSLDAEAFSKGWGWDDVDFSRRVRNEGFNLGVTPRVEVIHGVKRRGTESFFRNEKGDHEAMRKLDDINAQAYLQKWGDNQK